LTAVVAINFVAESPMDAAQRVAYAREVVGKDPLASFLGLTVEDVSEARAVGSPTPLYKKQKTHPTKCSV
jgi:hypothetical protein